MARILFVYKQFPAPSVGHAGGESLFGLMQALHQRGHQVSLVARILEAESGHVSAVRAICEDLHTVPHHRDLPGPHPMAMARSYLALRRAVQQRLNVEPVPDFVHVETTQTAVALFGLPLPIASFRTQDVNWFLQKQRTARARGLARVKAGVLQVLLRYLEPLLWRRYAVVLAISEGDCCLMLPHRRRRQALHLLPLAPAISPATDSVPAVTGVANVLFVGAMSRAHNINGVCWFTQHVWPHILATVPEARFYIVGGNPTPEVRALEDGETIFVTGYVDKLAPWYQAATVFVSPLLVAGGLLQKIVDAMAMGVPVVATSVCNHGLSARPSTHILTADTPEAFAAAVIQLLQDPAARDHIGTAGQRFICKNYSFETALDQWEQALLCAREMLEKIRPDVV